MGPSIILCLTMREWVQDIQDKRQRVLATFLPDLCSVFGFQPEDLKGRTSSSSERERILNDMRMIVLGSVMSLGRSLGLKWTHLCGPLDKGTTEIKDLDFLYRFTIRKSVRRFESFIQEGGEMGALLQRRFENIATQAHQAMESSSVLDDFQESKSESSTGEEIGSE